MSELMREHVEAYGFVLDSTGYRWVIDAPDDTPGSRTQLVLLPDDDGWIAEIHNHHDGGDPSSRAALPRLLTDEIDVWTLLQLCGVPTRRRTMVDESKHKDRGVSPRTEPRTRAEWKVAVDAAHAALCLDSARAYGLVTGGPAVDVVRCEEILRLGRSRGIKPARDCVERFVRALMAQGVG